MGKVIWAVLVSMVFSGVCWGATTFEVSQDQKSAVITEVLTNQPVQMMGKNNETVNIPGTTRDITTKIEVTKDQAQKQLAQLITQRASLVKQYNTMIANIDAQIKLLKDIDTALPTVEQVE
jgi:hypothetical protein